MPDRSKSPETSRHHDSLDSGREGRYQGSGAGETRDSRSRGRRGVVPSRYEHENGNAYDNQESMGRNVRRESLSSSRMLR